MATTPPLRAALIIQLRVLDGEGAVYATGSRATRGLTVQVTDESGKPVEGAVVSFTLPITGPGGTFKSGLRTEVVTTQTDGKAVIWGMQWNRTSGPFEIRITARKDQARAGIVSTQYLNDIVTPKVVGPSPGGEGTFYASHHSHTKWIVIGAVAAGAAGGRGIQPGVAHFRGGSSGSGSGTSDRQPEHPHWTPMMKPILIILLWSAHLASAQPAISPPQIGFVLDGTNSVRPMFGVAGSFLLGDSIGTDVVSCGFSSSIGFAKTESAVLVFDQDGQILYQTDAPPGPLLTASFVIYLTQTRALLRWTGKTLEPVPVTLDGDVLSIAQPDVAHVSAAIRRDENLWLVRFSLDSGAIESQSAISGIDGNLLLLNDGGFVFQNPEGIVIRRPDGTEIPLGAQLSQSIQFQILGNGWVQLKDSAGPQLAVDIRPGREWIFQLPEARP